VRSWDTRSFVKLKEYDNIGDGDEEKSLGITTIKVT